MEKAVHLTGEGSLLFVDNTLIAEMHGVARHVHACEKLPKPVLEPETSWEREGDDARIYIYGTVTHDAETGLFRMWYNRGSDVLYATSPNGLDWSRPELGLVDLSGSNANNCVLRGLHSPSIAYNPDAPPEERYAMLGYGKASGKGYYAAHSPDGLHWELYPENPALPAGDTCTLMYDARTGEYLAFHKRNVAWLGHERRTVYLAASRDLRQWSEPKLVMAPDAIDDAQTQAEGGRYSQFYNMSAFPYGGQYLGFVTHFRYTGPPAQKGPEQSTHDGPIDVQLVHSRDGREWNRCEDRSPVIPNGPFDYDAGCVLGVVNGVVAVGDEMWTYYTAITTTHGGFIPEKRIAIALAKWRLDGFVSLDAGEDEGIVKTVPFEGAGGHLVINAAGHLTVALLDPAGAPLPGYTHAECAVLTGDSVRHAVSWKEHGTVPNGRPIQLEFRMKDTQLYSFAFHPY